MTLQQFREILLSADPEAKHYRLLGGGKNFTRWMETGASKLSADSRYIDGSWSIRVDRFTKTEYDPVVEAIHAALDTDEIGYSYYVAYDLESDYIHHRWDCEAV